MLVQEEEPSFEYWRFLQNKVICFIPGHRKAYLGIQLVLSNNHWSKGGFLDACFDILFNDKDVVALTQFRLVNMEIVRQLPKVADLFQDKFFPTSVYPLFIIFPSCVSASATHLLIFITA